MQERELMIEPGDGKKVWHLQHLDLFADLTDTEIEELAALLHDRHIPAGVDLLGQRQRGQVYLVKEGTVSVDIGEGDQRLTAALLGPGRLLGLSEIVGEDGPGIAVTTLLPSYVCIATWSKLIEALTRHPSVLLKMLSSMAEQVVQLESWRARLGLSPPRARLAQLLLELAAEFGEATDHGQRFPFQLERAGLARMIGTSRETVSRAMAAFERDGWVGRENGHIVVRDTQALVNEVGKHQPSRESQP